MQTEHNKATEKVESTVSEKTRQETETPAQHKWLWVEAAVWTERMLAALVNGVKGGKWFSLMDKVYAQNTLQTAWQRVKSNKGAAGIDRVSIERFEEQSGQYLQELHGQLKTGTYQPQAVKRVNIPKANGGTRPLGIPTVKDRVVQMAIKLVIEPIFENTFRDTSHGFRPERGCKDALREVDGWLKAGYKWIVDADIKGYFDNISHELMMDKIEQHIADKQLLKLIEAYLKQDIMEEGKSWKAAKGTPQGAVLSPLLANIYLNELDHLIGEKYRMVRYADDFVILTTSEAEAEQALATVREWMASHHLELHPEKTRIVNENEDPNGFDFLGYNFKKGMRLVRKKSLTAMRDKIRLYTRRSQGAGITTVIEKLNPILRGWFNYFKHVKKNELRAMDGFVRRRLRSILRKYQKNGGGTGRNIQDHQHWTNAHFASLGLFTMVEAHAEASRSR
ncbi:MAG: group II intron reverse transcriptase/maturase [Methylococcaceae bacterium]